MNPSALRICSAFSCAITRVSASTILINQGRWSGKSLVSDRRRGRNVHLYHDILQNFYSCNCYDQRCPRQRLYIWAKGEDVEQDEKATQFYYPKVKPFCPTGIWPGIEPEPAIGKTFMEPLLHAVRTWAPPGSDDHYLAFNVLVNHKPPVSDRPGNADLVIIRSGAVHQVNVSHFSSFSRRVISSCAFFMPLRFVTSLPCPLRSLCA